MKYKINFQKHSSLTLTWCGLRGGISVALALSITQDMHRDLYFNYIYHCNFFYSFTGSKRWSGCKEIINNITDRSGWSSPENSGGSLDSGKRNPLSIVAWRVFILVGKFYSIIKYKVFLICCNICIT